MVEKEKEDENKTEDGTNEEVGKQENENIHNINKSRLNR